MKVILCHNQYQQPGGEDQSFAEEAALLEEHGHEVVRYTRHNDAIRDMGRLTLAAATLWNREVYRELRALIGRHRPVVMHCTNTFPLISPAAYYAARREGAAVVQSLRNYRLICPGANLMRGGATCEACVGKAAAWPGVIHACYRGSRSATAVVASMLALHRVRGTWRNAVDMYYALTEFARAKLVEGGLPADRVAIKPNFIYPDPGPGCGEGGYAIFVGRLAPEKGIDTLLAAWRLLQRPVRLKVVGDGPLLDAVRRAAADDDRLECCGWLPREQVRDLIGEAVCLVFPSIWYEGMPKTIIDALARGTPVVASRLGSMIEMVEHGVTGALVRAGDPQDLAASLDALFSAPDRLAAMRSDARRVCEARYLPEPNYRALVEIYERAIAHAAESRARQRLAGGGR